MRVYYYVLLDGEIKFSVWNQRIFQTRANADKKIMMMKKKKWKKNNNNNSKHTI